MNISGHKWSDEEFNITPKTEDGKIEIKIENDHIWICPQFNIDDIRAMANELGYELTKID